jgi:Fic family protein
MITERYNTRDTELRRQKAPQAAKANCGSHRPTPLRHNTRARRICVAPAKLYTFGAMPHPPSPALSAPPTTADAAELANLRALYDERARTVASGPVVDLEQAFPIPDDLPGLLDQLTTLERCLASFRPFNPGQMRVLQEQFDTEYTYESNRIEGNTLTWQETDLVVNKGMTIGGKPLKDHLEAVNHQFAIGLIRELASADREFGEEALLRLHAAILQGIDHANAGSYRTVRVRIKGSNHVFPNPAKVPDFMHDYFAFYAAQKNRLHPVELAALMHAKLVRIHPFIDGNGRTARLVMNLMLIRAGYPITIIASENASRTAYYDALEAFDHDEASPVFPLFVAQNVRRWCLTLLDLVSSDIAAESRHRGYAFFKQIEPLLRAG